MIYTEVFPLRPGATCNQLGPDFGKVLYKFDFEGTEVKTYGPRGMRSVEITYSAGDPKPRDVHAINIKNVDFIR